MRTAPSKYTSRFHCLYLIFSLLYLQCHGCVPVNMRAYLSLFACVYISNSIFFFVYLYAFIIRCWPQLAICICMHSFPRISQHQRCQLQHWDLFTGICISVFFKMITTVPLINVKTTTMSMYVWHIYETLYCGILYLDINERTLTGIKQLDNLGYIYYAGNEYIQILLLISYSSSNSTFYQ